MKAVTIDAPGPPEVLTPREMADPSPGRGDILIAVEAIPIEGGDVFARRVAPPPRPGYVMGYQAGGRVLRVGADVRRFRPGDRVATFGDGGAYAALRVVPEDLAWRVPDGADMEAAACVPTIFATADDALFAVGRLEPGQTVLVRGAGGGVGIAAVQLAHAAGARVIVTASRGETLRQLAGLGAELGVNHGDEPVAERVMTLNDGRGVDLTLDMAGGEGFAELLRCTRARGRIVCVGAATGHFANVPSMSLVVNELSVSGLFLSPHMASDRVRAIVDRHMAAFAQGSLRVPIAGRFALDEAAAAHRLVETGHPFGRVVMAP